MKIEEIITGPADLSEIRRYMGYYHVAGWEKQPGDLCDAVGNVVYADADPLIEKAVKLSGEVLENRVASERFPLTVSDGHVKFGNTDIRSKDLAKRLEGCSEVVLFGATSGFGLDRLIEKYKRIEPSLSYAISMAGSEHTEALCEGFCRKLDQELEKEGKEAVMRFSPGYGDLDLNVQLAIFRELELTKNLGITLNSSFLMTPVKSVTAFVGIRERN